MQGGAPKERVQDFGHLNCQRHYNVWIAQLGHSRPASFTSRSHSLPQVQVQAQVQHPPRVLQLGHASAPASCQGKREQHTVMHDLQETRQNMASSWLLVASVPCTPASLISAHRLKTRNEEREFGLRHKAELAQACVRVAMSCCQ